MRSTRQRLAAVTLLGGLTTLGIGLTAGPASAALNTECSGIIGQAQSGSLHATGTPSAGSDVVAGSAVNFSGAWNDADYEETDRFYVCGSVDGNYSAAMSSMEKPLDNDGSFSAPVAVPANLPVGTVHWTSAHVPEVVPAADLGRLELLRLFDYHLGADATAPGRPAG